MQINPMASWCMVCKINLMAFFVGGRVIKDNQLITFLSTFSYLKMALKNLICTFSGIQVTM